MQVRAKLFAYTDITKNLSIVELTRAGGNDSLEGAVRAKRQMTSWQELPNDVEIDLRTQMLVITGGRKSIARFLLIGGGYRPMIRGNKPMLGTLRETGLFTKNKTCMFLTGRGNVPLPEIKHANFEPLVPHLRDGYTNWQGQEVNSFVTPRQLAGAVCHAWGLDINEVMREKYLD